MLTRQICKDLLLSALSEKFDRLQLNLDDIRASLTNETKSSAGDKYETSRAMLHAEQDNLQRQMQELKGQLAIVTNLDTHSEKTVIGKGSIVQTNTLTFYISVAAGKLSFEDLTFLPVSASSPLGQKMMGLSKGQSISVNGTTYLIKEVS